jgi:ABC-2 type transport system permease protein
MNTLSSSMPESDQPAATPSALSPTRPLYWSLRRELWENKSIYMAPAIAAAVVFLAVVISVFHGHSELVVNGRRVLGSLGTLEPAQQAALLLQRHGYPAAALAVVTLIVGVFYCLDALHSERRDRSILFWKSLPVSDFTTVLSKALIAMVVLPVVTYAVVIVMEILILPLSLLQVDGVSLATLWDRLPLFQLLLVMLYGLVVSALWYAPVYGWLLLVSGWARRAPFLWGVLPPFALAVFEKIAFGTSYLGRMIEHRLAGGGAEAFATAVHEKGAPFTLPQIDIVKFLGSTGLWIGLAVAVVFFFIAVRQRRYSGPL